MGMPSCDCIPPDGDDWTKPWIRECDHHRAQRQSEYERGRRQGITDVHDSLRREQGANGDAEPVAWMDEFGNAFPLGANKGAGSWRDEHKRNWRLLYTRPSRPLTDEQLERIADHAFDDVATRGMTDMECLLYFARAVERKIME
jgi:hypothetical protein